MRLDDSLLRVLFPCLTSEHVSAWTEISFHFQGDLVVQFSTGKLDMWVYSTGLGCVRNPRLDVVVSRSCVSLHF